MPAGGYVEVDTSRRYKRVINHNGDNAYEKLTDNSDYIKLESGANSLVFTGAESVMIAWRDSWV